MTSLGRLALFLRLWSSTKWKKLGLNKGHRWMNWLRELSTTSTPILLQILPPFPLRHFDLSFSIVKGRFPWVSTHLIYLWVTSENNLLYRWCHRVWDGLLLQDQFIWTSNIALVSEAEISTIREKCSPGMLSDTVSWYPALRGLQISKSRYLRFAKKKFEIYGDGRADVPVLFPEVCEGGYEDSLRIEGGGSLEMQQSLRPTDHRPSIERQK